MITAIAIVAVFFGGYFWGNHKGRVSVIEEDDEDDCP